MAELEQEIAQKIDGFALVNEQWMRIKEMEAAAQGTDTAVRPGFFNRYFAEDLFEDRERDLNLAGLLLIVLLLVLAPYARLELPCESVFRTTLRGRAARLGSKAVFGAAVSLLIGGAVYAAAYAAVFSGYPEEDFSVAAACLPGFSGWDVHITMQQVLALSFGSKVLGSFLAALLIAAAALLSLEATAYYLLLVVLLGVPLLLVPVQWFGLTGLFFAEKLAGESMTGYLVYLGVCTASVSAWYLAAFTGRVRVGRGKTGRHPAHTGNASGGGGRKRRGKCPAGAVWSRRWRTFICIISGRPENWR